MQVDDTRDARICVVDDNRLDRERLIDALSGIGHVEAFEDGESALRSIVRPRSWTREPKRASRLGSASSAAMQPDPAEVTAWR